MFAKAAKKVRRQGSGVAAFSEISISSLNIPGKRLDLASDSDAARAARAIQEAVLVQGNATFEDGSVATAEDDKVIETEDGSVIIHMEATFAQVRLHFARSSDKYKKSLAEGALRFLGEEEAAGKSDAFFVFTEDGQYCVKAVAPKEAQMLLRVLESYKQHVLEHPDTLLPKFYGMYEVRLVHHRQPLWMLVQGNVLGGRSGVIQRFDLKGSTHGRTASAKERSKGRGSVLKDLDYVSEGCTMLCNTPEEQQTWEHWVRTMEEDTAWLASQGLIDYSLLLGFSVCPRESLKKPLSHVKRLEVRHEAVGNLIPAMSSSDALLVYVGIVDCLMPYNWFKRLENYFCDALFSADISCQPPEKYASRFMKFVERMALPPGELQHFTEKRKTEAQRLLGTFVGEFGRKDMKGQLINQMLVIAGGIGLFMACRQRVWTRSITR